VQNQAEVPLDQEMNELKYKFLTLLVELFHQAGWIYEELQALE